MSDLISRQDALSVFHSWIDKRGDVHDVDEIPEYEAIENLPSADAVEVVRCKDCKFYVKNNPTVLCLRDSSTPEWFCADGERRE